MSEPTTQSRTGYSGGFVFVMIAITAVCTFASVKWFDRQDSERAAIAIKETAEAEFKRIGLAYQAKGNITDNAGILAQTKATMGAALAREAQRRGGSIVSTVAASGLVPASASPLGLVPTLPEQTGWSGTIAQDRGGLPPLTTAHIAFDAASGLRVAWENRSETFNLSFTEWRTSADGLRAAVRLQRVVGLGLAMPEEIPLTNADAYFPASEVMRVAPISKGDIGFGPFLDTHSHVTRPLIYTSKRWSRKWSTSVIAIPHLGYSAIAIYSLGGK